MAQTGPGVHPNSYPTGTGSPFPGGKAVGEWTHHWPPTSAEVKKTWIYTSTPHTSSSRSPYLVKYRSMLTSTYLSATYLEHPGNHEHNFEVIGNGIAPHTQFREQSLGFSKNTWTAAQTRPSLCFYLVWRKKQAVGPEMWHQQMPRVKS
jgi:hypothetical protein